MPIIAARTPARIESDPSDGPTVRSSRYLMPAGSAPEFRTRARSLACLLAHAAAADPPLVMDLLLDGGHFPHPVIQDHREFVAHVGAGKRRKLSSTLVGKDKADVR